MKYKTTVKEVYAQYHNVICVGYCNLQSLLNYDSPVAYLTRAEGWRADVYRLSWNTAVVTGYAPFGNIRPSYELCRRYDLAALKALADPNLRGYEEITRTLDELKEKFVQEALEEHGKREKSSKTA